MMRELFVKRIPSYFLKSGKDTNRNKNVFQITKITATLLHVCDAVQQCLQWEVLNNH